MTALALAARFGGHVTGCYVAIAREAGSVLWRLATQERADLLVMGAYGRSRLRERTLGGATRYLLHHASIPMLGTH